MNFGKEAEKRRRNRYLLFLAASLCVHLFFLFVAPHFSWNFDSEKLAQKPIELELDPAMLKEIEKMKSLQIAESEKADNKTPPKDAKYFGEHDQEVEKETKARNGVTFQKGGGNAMQAGNAPQQGFSLKNLAPKQEITPPTEAEADQIKKQQVAQQRQEAGGQVGGQKASTTSDYLKDIKEGDRTLLSTKEFVYFGYFRRIRERLELAWNSKLRSTMEQYFMSGRQLASDRHYVTKVVVVLDRHGRITAVQMISGSGARDLDQAAVEAFNQAGPFPDPPSGLVDKDGSIKIPWEFILQS